MGKITRAEIVDYLRELNPDSPEHDFAIYTDAFLSYSEAQENIAKNGMICAHPRTAAPIDNPYAAVRDRMAATLRKINLQTGALWKCQERWFVAVCAAEDERPEPDEFMFFLAPTAQLAADAAAKEAGEYVMNYCHVASERGGPVERFTIENPD